MLECRDGKFSHLASTAASQQGVLSYEQLRVGGLTQRQIQYQVSVGRLVRHNGRVFTLAGSPDSLDQLTFLAAMAAALHTRIDDGSVGAASHRTAARLYGMRTVDSDVDVSVQYPRRLNLAGVNVIRSRDLDVRDVTWVEDIPVTTPERTIVDLGLFFPEHEVLRVLRHAVATGLVNRREVLSMRLRTSKQGRNGAGVSGRCLEALADDAEQTESGPEALFLEVCERYGLPAPAIQLPVIANGSRYRLDFAYPTHRIFVEIDGAPHDDVIRIAMDGGRQNDLVAAGWHPVRLHYQQLVKNPETCASVIRQLLTICEPESTIIGSSGSQKSAGYL